MIEGNANYNHRIDFEKVYKILEISEGLKSNEFETCSYKELELTDDALAYYFERMYEAKFIVYKKEEYFHGNIAINYPIITYKGHEYLANLRNDTIRSKVKEKVSKVGGSVSINLITKIASEIVMKSIM